MAHTKSVQFSRFIKISFTYPGDEYDRSALEPAKLTYSERSELMQLRMNSRQDMSSRRSSSQESSIHDHDHDLDSHYIDDRYQGIVSRRNDIKMGGSDVSLDDDSDGGYSSDEGRVPVSSPSPSLTSSSAKKSQTPF